MSQITSIYFRDTVRINKIIHKGIYTHPCMHLERLRKRHVFLQEHVTEVQCNADLLIPLGESILDFMTCGDFFILANLQMLHKQPINNFVIKISQFYLFLLSPFQKRAFIRDSEKHIYYTCSNSDTEEHPVPRSAVPRGK